MPALRAGLSASDSLALRKSLELLKKDLFCGGGNTATKASRSKIEPILGSYARYDLGREARQDSSEPAVMSATPMHKAMPGRIPSHRQVMTAAGPA